MGISEVDTPDRSVWPRIEQRPQPTVPAGFTEIPRAEEPAAPAFTPAEPSRGFMLFTRPIERPIHDTTVPAGSERVERLAAFATLGEYEPMTFAVHALRDLVNLRAEISPLRCGDRTIGQEHLDLRMVTEWMMRYPMYSSKTTCQRQPELLEKVTVVSFPKGQSRRYWIKAHVPPDAAPGVYSGWVTLFDDVSTRAVRLPVALRVLDFALQRDPAKRYSVYYYSPDQTFRGMTGALLRTAMSNDFATMQSYGIDMFPTVPLSARKGADGVIEVHVRDPESVDAMIAAGFKGPIPLTGGVGLFYTTHVPGGRPGPHWALDKFPTNDAIYRDIERAFRAFRIDAAARGWPETICCPLDEVAPASAEFAARVNAAIRRSGMKTYITKDPTAADAAVYRLHDAVDAWCSQPYAMPYEKVVRDVRHDYWCYPNHNAGEIKDRTTMQKGGRMTYGFGFWRSGYTVLIPWHWRWAPCKEDAFDYLRGPQSGCGTRMDEAGNVIPPVYWECFREGYDDARYLYTLQQALHDRRDARDPRCRALVEQGRALLQEIWDSIEPQEKHLAAGMWDDAQFGATRWRLATAIDALRKFSAAPSAPAPSVMADPTRARAVKPDPLERAAQMNILDRRDLGGTDFAGWTAADREASVGVVRTNGLAPVRPTLRMTVDVDHRTDGAGGPAKYPVGWPRIARTFAADEVDLAHYDFLTFNIKIDSNRDEVADDSTPFIVNFASHEGARQDMFVDLGDRQRTWVPVRIAIPDPIRKSSREPTLWRRLRLVQLVVAESNYRDGTHLEFEIDRIELVKVRQPLLMEIDSADTILLPAQHFAVGVSGLGLNAGAGGYRLDVKLCSAGGAAVAARDIGLAGPAQVTLDLPDTLKSGRYTLTAAIVDPAGNAVSVERKPVDAIPGPLASP